MNATDEVFAGLSIWNYDRLTEVLPNLPKKHYVDAPDEYELPDAIALCSEAGGIVETFRIPEAQALGLNEPDEFYLAESYIKQHLVSRLRERSVQVLDAATINLDISVEVGRGSLLRGPVSLHGDTIIGDNSIIGPGTTLIDCGVGSNCVIGSGSWERATFPPGSRAADRLRSRNRYFDREQYLIPVEDKLVFVLTPFHEPYATLFRSVVRPTIEAAGFACRLGERVEPGVITNQVWEDINRARLIIAEISERNTNVWYELGIAHALNKPTILLSKSHDLLTDPRSFMVRHLRVLTYTPDKGDLGPSLLDWLQNGNYC